MTWETRQRKIKADAMLMTAQLQGDSDERLARTPLEASKQQAEASAASDRRFMAIMMMTMAPKARSELGDLE